MNDLSPINAGTAVNPWAAYADDTAATANLIKGDLLKFIKGRWVTGQANTRVPDGTTYELNMNETMVGWQCWKNVKVVAAQFGAIASGYRPVQRNVLGDNDASAWELDEYNRPKDPWVLTSVLYLKDSDGDDLTFSTSSVGGRNAISDLCKQYGTQMNAHPGANPIVAIGTDEYEHKKHGLTFTPTLKIVGWSDGDAPLLAEVSAPAAKPTSKTKF